MQKHNLVPFGLGLFAAGLIVGSLVMYITKEPLDEIVDNTSLRAHTLVVSLISLILLQWVTIWMVFL